jgi:hypothetical protein
LATASFTVADRFVERPPYGVFAVNAGPDKVKLFPSLESGAVPELFANHARNPLLHRGGVDARPPVRTCAVNATIADDGHQSARRGARLSLGSSTNVGPSESPEHTRLGKRQVPQ